MNVLITLAQAAAMGALGIAGVVVILLGVFWILDSVNDWEDK